MNYSPEKTPIKIVACHQNEKKELKTKACVFEIEPQQKTEIELTSDKEFLLYNEEREVVSLTSLSSSYLLRNQQILEIDKKNGPTFLLKKDKAEAYQLTAETKTLWNKSDGLFQKDQISGSEMDIFEEMTSEELIKEMIMGVPGIIH
ncbi:hypothetical protein [Flavivirga algicola]|uniref:Uncharacterized protein n=1 Tax=Flavivirga algicola TaxID=2729136 RepID=A0ABX1S128_9FLAO|nr:hypothetical protein [Flavivirga algicola]NMH89061.1 hypothetical protein [Flavivirga algicola]